MQKSSLSLQQKMQQKLSPQQILFIKMLQMNTIELDQLLKGEMDENPFLEVGETENNNSSDSDSDNASEERAESEKEKEVEAVDEHNDIDWDEYIANTEAEYDYSTTYNPDKADWEDIPKPYQKNLLEELEEQVALMGLTEKEYLIAEQILGSIDSDGYFRRDPEAIVDNIAFNHDVFIMADEVESIRKRIQRLDPPGIASLDLRDCLLAQLRVMPPNTAGRDTAFYMIKDEWDAFQKKHFDKLMKKLDCDGEELQKAYDVIRSLDPKPGFGTDIDVKLDYIEPDFVVQWVELDDEEQEEYKQITGTIKVGEFEILLNRKNRPPIRISSTYKTLWEDNNNTKAGAASRQKEETNKFIKEKIEKAKWYMDAIQQRQNTLLNVMEAIVELQERFFKTGKGLRPMILKDVAERVKMDISTISRVTKQKYVQTPFGTFELKYFFSEGMETESGENVSTRAIKNALQRIVDDEDKTKPLSDDRLVKELAKEGYQVARRTVTKYREQLAIPVARMRKELVF